MLCESAASAIRLLLTFMLAAVANWQAIETFHHGSIFEQLRARLESRRDWISELTGCPFCLSHWTGLAFATLSFVYSTWEHLSSPVWLVFPAYVLAVIRASQWLNDRTAYYCRTPNRKVTHGDTESDGQ
jgi:hypothetical protein